MALDDSTGFRFHPTEQEIISYFLERKMCYPAWPCRTIREVKNICKFEPWFLPEHSPLPSNDQVWYFFNVPVSMSPNSTRIDRTTNVGFWKPTGRVRPIRDKQGKKEIGYKRNLVFHRGRSHNGIGTKWVMHEYHSNKVSPDKEEYVIFRLKRKSGDSTDTYDEPSYHLASDSRNHVDVAASQDSNFFSQLLSSIQPAQQVTSCSNGLDRNSLSALFSLVQSEQGTSYSNGADHNPLSELFFSTQQSEQRTSYSNVADRNPRSALFSSIQQSEQRTSTSNGTGRNPLSALFSSTLSEQRPSHSNGADLNHRSALFSSIQQSEQRTSTSNGTGRNPLSELFPSIQQSEQRTSYSNGTDHNPLSELFSTIQQSEQRTSYANGVDRNPLSELFSPIQQEQGNSRSALSPSIQQEQGSLISIGFNDEWNFLNSPFNSIEQEDAFLYLSDQDEYIHTVLHDVNPPKSMGGMFVGDSNDTYADLVITEEDDFLYLSDQDEYNGEIHTVLHDVNPPKSMRGMNVGDSSDTYADFVITEGGPELEIPILLNGNASSEESWQVPMVRASNGTSSSSVGGRYRGDSGVYLGVNKQFELQSGNSDTEMFEINCLDELQMAEFPPSPRTCKAQHMPKSHRVIQEKCATERFQLLGMVSNKQASNDEAREAATSVIDLPWKENNTDKFDKEQKMAQSTNAKTSSKIRSNDSEGSNNRKGSTSPLGHKTIPPFVYIGNMLVSFVLILFFIREMTLFIE